MTPMKPDPGSDDINHEVGLMHLWPPQIMTKEFTSDCVYGLRPSNYIPESYPERPPDFDHLLKFEEYPDATFNQLSGSRDHFPPTTSQLQLADLELDPTWTAPTSYPQYQQINNQPQLPSSLNGVCFLPYSGAPISPPNSTYHYFEEGPIRTPWSSPEYTSCRPVSSVDDEDDINDDKPYAKLIYEALLQAPGHRMMLRDIYDWFRQNTMKAQENGTNGWQNSIRHNLSMNKAFENDREQGRGNSRKANSIWILTEDAIQNGVQSTTRYRKAGCGKRALGSRTPALQRQKSGAKGGRAARRTARHRHRDQNLLDHPTPSSCSPDTPAYSDVSDYGLDNHDYHPAFSSCPLTPVEGHSHLVENTTRQLYYPATNHLDYDPHHTTYGLDDTLRLQNLLLRPTRDQYTGGMADLQAE